MPSSRSLTTRLQCSLGLLLLVLLGGCAPKKWASLPLPADEQIQIRELLVSMQVANRLCPKGLDANAQIFWKSPLSNAAVSGYLELQEPSFIKFIVTNPLGMVVYALSSTGQIFQFLDISQRQYIRGSVRNLAIRQGIPRILGQANWSAILSAKLPSGPFTPQQISRDTDGHSVWIQIPQSSTYTGTAQQWLHLEPEQRRVLGYLFLDQDGTNIAEISYGKPEAGARTGCLSSQITTHISNLPWGAEITIRLEDAQGKGPTLPSDFTLPVPTGFFEQLQP